MSQLIYDKLCEIVSSNCHHLTHNHADFYGGNRHELTKAPQSRRYLWILREHGTELFPVGIGVDPRWATFWLCDRNYGAVKPKTFEIDLGRESVTEIDYDRARELANVPPANGRRFHANQDQAEVVAA